MDRKVFVCARGGDKLDGIELGEFELPLLTVDLLEIVKKNGRFELFPPESGRHPRERHLTLWTMEFQNDYD